MPRLDPNRTDPDTMPYSAHSPALITPPQGDTGGAQLSIIVPTFNEIENVQEIVSRVRRVLQEIRWEIIFVDDDSPDGTAEKVKSMALMDPQIRCIKRIGRRGLSSACIEGMLSSSAHYLAVMDGDLQHDEALLATMYRVISQEEVDLVVGTRYMEGGGVGDWDKKRQASSKWATQLSQRLLRVSLKDPMSGFFMIKRQAFESCVSHLSSMGFKILLDIVASAPKPLVFREVAFHFRERHAGESKLDQRVIWDYFLLLIDKKLGSYIPASLISFGLIGSMGVLVHLGILGLCLNLLGVMFTQAQICAVLGAMVFNFYLNNMLTYRDQKLSGFDFYLGLVKFILTCSIGAVANVGVASFIYKGYGYWVFSGLAGILVGVVWNYVATSLVVWPKRQRKKINPQ
jgi:dolichol-phosphate mannosyltransferase